MSKVESEFNHEITIYLERMRVLGNLRLLILKCINAISPKSPGYFNPGAKVDLFDACRRHFEIMYEQATAQANFSEADLAVAIFAAGLLTYSRLEMAEIILRNIKSKYETDHGCGYCNLVPMLIFSTVLPLPKEIGYCSLTEGRIDLEAAKSWLCTNKALFRWDAETERFLLDERNF